MAVSKKKSAKKSSKKSAKKAANSAAKKASGQKPATGSRKSKDTITVFSWNVNGIRAVMKKGFLDWFEANQPDIFCLQETRATVEQVQKEAKARPVLNLESYEYIWADAEKKGYSGVATFYNQETIPAKSAQAGFENDDPDRQFNNEGRVAVTDHGKFILWNSYFPNGGRGPERVQYKLDFYEHCLKKWEEYRKAGRHLIITGDWNTAHKEIDLARPKENQKTSGFLPEERAFIDKLVDMGYVDVFRSFDDSPGMYTYWDQITRARDRNVGWRIDYFMVPKESEKLIQNAFIQMDVTGSDHCPLGIEVKYG